MFASAFTVFAVALATLGLAFPPVATLEERQSSTKCVTYKSGYLATDVTNGTWAPFSLDSSNNIVYTTPPGTPIAIQFQTCNPNWAKNDTGSENLYYGRIYVPSSQSCVGLDAAAGTASLVSCLDSADGAMATAASAPQNFAFSTYDNISLYWYGASSQSTDYVSYDGCNGFYAYFHGSEYASPPNNTPVVTTGNLVQYQCDYYNGDTTIFGALRPTPAGTV